MDLDERLTKIEDEQGKIYNILKDIVCKISDKTNGDDWALLMRTLSPEEFRKKYRDAFGMRLGF